MSSVIFDNATLSAVQRLMGTAPAPKWYDIQGDYSALENFITNLLFYDDFYIVDDYYEGLRELRRHDFPYCRRIARDTFSYERLADQAKELVEDLILDIRGGNQQPGLIKDFLNSVGLYMTCAWHLQSSDYFLVLKILAEGGDELRNKYSPLTALIFNQLSGHAADINNNQAFNLVGSDGKKIAWDDPSRIKGIDRDLLQFVRSLNWLALRVAFYTLVSANFGAAACLHPIRHNFPARWTTERSILENPNGWRERLVAYFSEKAAATVNLINEAIEPAVIGITLPLLAAWAVGTAGSVSASLNFILDVRQKPESFALRRHLEELDELRREHQNDKFKKSVNRLRAALETEAENLTRRYGRGSDTGVAPSVSLTAQLAPLPSLGMGVTGKTPSTRIISRFTSSRHLRVLFRNVVDDIVRFDKLGAVRTSLWKQVRRSREEGIPTLRIEDIRYFGKESSWKRPM